MNYLMIVTMFQKVTQIPEVFLRDRTNFLSNALEQLCGLVVYDVVLTVCFPNVIFLM